MEWMRILVKLPPSQRWKRVGSDRILRFRPVLLNSLRFHQKVKPQSCWMVRLVSIPTVKPKRPGALAPI